MKIIVDAFGGDNAPKEILLGCVRAQKELGVEIILSGNRDQIALAGAALASEGAEGFPSALPSMEVLHCQQVIGMEDESTSVVKEKGDSSMAVGLQALAQGKADAFASAGNSGALVVGATMITKRIKGIKRVTFAPILPKSQGFFMLSDGGANVDCRPEMLLQFGLMGGIYMKQVMGVAKPRVGLANVGTEAHKGDELRHQAYALLQACPDIHFIGNVEARDIPYDAADVVVCDGFTGNMMVKLYEGVAMALMDKIKGVFQKSLKNKLAAAAVYNDMKALKKSMDYNEYGGAPIMGAAKPVFKIHGSAKASTVVSALRLTRDYAASGIIQVIESSVAGKGEVL